MIDQNKKSGDVFSFHTELDKAFMKSLAFLGPNLGSPWRVSDLAWLNMIYT